MPTPSRRLFSPAGHAAAALAAMLASSTELAGQMLSSRPASVALTVVVPGRAHVPDSLSTGTDVTVVRRSATAADIETQVGVGERLTSRVEVRLGTGWASDSARVWIRNSTGVFERLVADTRVIALDAPRVAPSRTAVTFRIESDGPLPPLVVPLEYRLKIGVGDQAATWSFESHVRLEGRALEGAR